MLEQSDVIEKREEICVFPLSSDSALQKFVDATYTVVNFVHLISNQERAKADKINRKLRQQLADYRVPDVMDYVQEKADLYEIQKKVKSWERKVEIAEVINTKRNIVS